MTVLQSDVDLSQELRETVAEIAAFDIDEIQPGSMLFDDIGLDSIMMMDIFATLTKRYPELRSVDATDPRWREDMPYRALENALLTLVGVELESTDDVAAPGIETMQRIVDFNAGLRQRDVRTYFVPHENVAGATVRVGGRELINYGSYNYLGSNGDERINRAVAEAIDTYGTSVSAARIIGGEIPLHQELEQELADFLGVDDALVLVGGHSTNVNVIGHLFGDGDLILHDSLAHNSIIQGALMSSARRKPFRHNDPASLEKELSRLRRKFDNVLVVVEGIYSMDGDIAALEAMLEIKERYGAFLMVDEAHSFGTIGEAGRGITSHGNVDPRRVDILMGTLSKALNSCGGYIAGNAELIRYLRYQLPGFLFSVGITPANTAAALESLRLCRENPQWITELRTVSQDFLQRATTLGVDTGLSAGTPIVPLITGDSARAAQLSVDLFDEGVNVAPIAYPAVAEHEARLRFFLSRLHTPDHLDTTFEMLARLVGEDA